MIRLGSHYLHHGWGQTELEVFVPELWYANEPDAYHRGQSWLQGTAHLWLQGMRGMGHGRKYPEQSGRRHSLCAEMAWLSVIDTPLPCVCRVLPELSTGRGWQWGAVSRRRAAHPRGIRGTYVRVGSGF